MASAPEAPRIALPRWLLGGAGIALFAGCVLALTSARSRTSESSVGTQAPTSMTALAPNSTVSQPPEVVSRIRDKIRYFEADLRLEPKNEALLLRVAQTYAALALAIRETHPDEARSAIEHARQIADRREQLYPRAMPPLGWVQQDLEQLTWATEGAGVMLSQMMASSAMAGGAPMMMTSAGGAPPGGRVLEQGRPQGGPGSPSIVTPGAPSPLIANGPTRSEAERGIRATIRQCLEKRREEPDDLINLDALGAAYQRLAALEPDPRKRKSNPSLKLALEVFRDAAQRSRLRIHKASFLRAAGQVYGELGDSMSQYRMAKLASEQAPFSFGVWDELQDASLRVGRFADSREASRKAKAWRLPTIREATVPPTPFPRR